jgi:hypothetical protein
MSVTSTAVDQALTPSPAATVGDVIQRLQAIDAALPDDNGLKWFNFLYLAVTRAVDDKTSVASFFADPLWISSLDVVFANLYFAAIKRSAKRD